MTKTTDSGSSLGSGEPGPDPFLCGLAVDLVKKYCVNARRTKEVGFDYRLLRIPGMLFPRLVLF